MYIDELKKEINIDNVFDNKLTIFKQNMIIIEGYKKLLTYENDVISYVNNNSTFVINGSNLKIEKININEIIISGEIKGISIEKN